LNTSLQFKGLQCRRPFSALAADEQQLWYCWLEAMDKRP